MLLTPRAPQGARLSFAARLALAALRLYRRIFSPWLAAPCRFVPSCSEYAEQAVALRGARVGLALAAWRLVRCHPLGGKGLDPVPARPGLDAPPRAGDSASRPSPAVSRGH